MVSSSHCSVGRVEFILFSGASGVHIVQWGEWSSYCSVGFFRVHIVQWVDLKFILYSVVV